MRLEANVSEFFISLTQLVEGQQTLFGQILVILIAIIEQARHDQRLTIHDLGACALHLCNFCDNIHNSANQSLVAIIGPLAQFNCLLTKTHSGMLTQILQRNRLQRTVNQHCSLLGD